MARALLPGIAAALGFGVAFGYIWPGGPWTLLPAAFALILAAILRWTPGLWLASLFLGMALARPPSFPAQLDFQLPLLQECTGYVADLPEPTAKRLSFTVEVPNLGVRLLAYIPQDLSVYPGERVRLFGRYEVPKPEGYREYLARRGVRGLFFAERVEILSKSRGGIPLWAAQAREKIHSLLSPLPEKSRALLSALLLGSRGFLSPEEKEAFREAGVAHLLALSGLHVGILVAGGWFLLGLFRLPKAWRYFLLIPAVGLYVLIGGLRVSLLRAAVMFGVVGLFWILWEWGWVSKAWLDSLQGLSFAAILVLLIWPWSALDAAFQLSFSATAGILFLWPSWSGSAFRRGLPRLPRYVADLLAVSAAAQLGVLPFLAASFGYLSSYGLLANLILIPWTTLFLWAGILGLPFLLVPTRQPWVGQALGWLAEPYLELVGAIGNLPGATLPVGQRFGLWYLCALLAILILRAAEEDLSPLEFQPKWRRAWPG
ncbi:MAG: ComEC/Rec2 family competence protein [Candidatus Bipolaricaulaceae bacterium]